MLEENSFLQQSIILEIPAGENYKTLSTCEKIWQQLLECGADRNALLINLGGGVITDMGGFMASLYKRGIDFINIPTTLLAMTDAAIGGKTGIDFLAIKNTLGTFQEAQHTFIFPDFLNTLPDIELLSGYAEIIKHALIADISLWQELQFIHPLQFKNWLTVIEKSVTIKQQIVTQDFKESGIRKTLNFGHTIGHALESYALKEEKLLPHGIAIAMGMIAESYLSVKNSGLPKATFENIASYLLKIYQPYFNIQVSTKKLLPFLLNDKKNSSKKLLFIQLQNISEAIYNVEVNEQNIDDAMIYLQKYNYLH